MGSGPLDITGDTGPGRPGSPVRLRIELVVAVALAIALGLLAVGFVGTAFESARPHGSTRLGQAVGAVVCLALAVLCTRWAIDIEHRLRGNQPVARGFAAADMPSGSRRWLALFGWRRRGRYSPVGGTVVLLFLSGAAIGFAVGAISDHAQADRSSYVQHHGTPAVATVDSVTNTQHCSRSHCSYTAAVALTLPKPVDGTETTVAHYSGFATLSSGENVRVLVDPKQPGYAEFPGSPFKGAAAWIAMLIIAVVFAAIAITDGLALRRMLGHRREHAATTLGGLPTT
ncbi:MAG: hypothetical protein M3071_25490 [Actinomycetota bacterium]|nr:hypothetical protein [Actinomycetota bacterium]